MSRASKSLLRIATGADAADTAFLTVINGRAELGNMEVTAVVEPGLPIDEVAELVPARVTHLLSDRGSGNSRFHEHDRTAEPGETWVL